MNSTLHLARPFFAGAHFIRGYFVFPIRENSWNLTSTQSHVRLTSDHWRRRGPYSVRAKSALTAGGLQHRKPAESAPEFTQYVGQNDAANCVFPKKLRTENGSF
jgi:hypothetical protein